jgi:hypothetical protein
MKKPSKRIPSLPTDQEAAEYWNTHSLAELIEDTGESTIRFVRRPRKRLAPDLTLRLSPRHARGDSRS